MPWFWGGGDQNDPAKSLDPDLKQFLNEQKIRTYEPSNAPSKVVPDRAPVQPTQDNAVEIGKEPEEKELPRESLFQDGRYKHLWKTYIPQSTIEAATLNPVEQVISARKDRRSAIHRAALENCAFEQELQQQCLGTGVTSSIKSKMTMCQQETKAFNRCYQLQAKFLQALGYLASATSSDDHEERIQMHADKLYHRMMDYEEDLENARRNNLPIPPLSSVFDPSQPAPRIDEFKLPERVQERLETPLGDLPPHERELAARAALQDVKFSAGNANDFHKFTTTQNEQRQKRQQMLTRAFGDVIGKFLIPDPPKDTRTQTAEENLTRDVWSNEGFIGQVSTSKRNGGGG